MKTGSGEKQSAPEKGGAHTGHRKRSREKFLCGGLKGFSSEDALEMLLFYAVPRQDTRPLACTLLETFGSLDGVLQASPRALLQVKGVGESAAMLLPLAYQAFRRGQTDLIRPGTLVKSYAQASEVFMRYFWGAREEAVVLLTLDRQDRLIAHRAVGDGMDSVDFSVSSVVQFAVEDKAASVYLAHNHPSGVAMPSQEDVNTTQRIYTALQAVNIELVDHLVIVDDDYISMESSELIVRQPRDEPEEGPKEGRKGPWQKQQKKKQT